MREFDKKNDKKLVWSSQIGNFFTKFFQNISNFLKKLFIISSKFFQYFSFRKLTRILFEIFFWIFSKFPQNFLKIFPIYFKFTETIHRTHQIQMLSREKWDNALYLRTAHSIGTFLKQVCSMVPDEAIRVRNEISMSI